jgi:pimeloyl-ACP methyl ester carboxylesterase
MGGATAIRAFHRIPQARVLISDAAFSSINDLLRDRIPQDIGVPPLFYPNIIIGFTNNFSQANLYEASPIDAIGELADRPVFLSHGTADRVVPFINGQRLFEAASEPKEFYVVQGAGHTQAYFNNPAAYEAHLMPFLDRYLVNEE